MKAETFDKQFDEGTDIIDALDLSGAKRVNAEVFDLSNSSTELNNPMLCNINFPRRHFLLTMFTGLTGSLLGCGGSGSRPILLPAYFYDQSLWNAALKPRIPGHEIIVNVDSGPGLEADTYFQRLFDQARTQAHKLMGYIATGYGAVSPESILTQAKTWMRFYDIRDVFLDEVSDGVDKLEFYRTLVTRLIDGYPSRSILLNPGTVPDEGYYRLSETVRILAFEDTWEQYQQTVFPAWLNAYWPRTSIMVYEAPIDALQPVYDFALQKMTAGFFVTDARGAIYHEQLPSYWEQELDL